MACSDVPVASSQGMPTRLTAGRGSLRRRHDRAIAVASNDLRPAGRSAAAHGTWIAASVVAWSATSVGSAPIPMHRSLLADVMGTAASLATPSRRRTPARLAPAGVSAPAALALAAAPADRLPRRGRGRGDARRLPRTPGRRPAADPHRHGRPPGLRADGGSPRDAHPRAVRGRRPRHHRGDRPSRDRAVPPDPGRRRAGRRGAAAPLRRSLLLLARAHAGPLRPSGAVLPAGRRNRPAGHPDRPRPRRLLRRAGPRHGAAPGGRAPGRPGPELRRRARHPRRRVLSGRLPFHVGQPAADRRLQRDRLPRRSRRPARRTLRGDRGRRPRAAPQPRRRAAPPAAPGRGRRRPPDHRCRAGRQHLALRVRALRPPVLPRRAS